MDKEDLLPTPKIAERWVNYLAAIRAEVDAGKREHKFQHAHGYLRALVDAELLSDAALTELRELLINVVGRRA